MSEVQDPWESGPQYPPWIEDAVKDAHKQPGNITERTSNDRRARKIGAVAAGLLLFSGSAAAYIELSQSPSRQAIARRQQRQRREFILGAVSAAAKGDFHYCRDYKAALAPQRYRRQAVIGINDRLRRRLKEPPLHESRLLDEYAQQTAAEVADKPALLNNLDAIPPTRLSSKIGNSLVWKDIRIQAQEHPAGQTIRAAGCMADSASNVEDSKVSADVGVGSATRLDQSYLIVDYGVRNSG